MTSTALLGKKKIDILQSQLNVFYDTYVDARRHYEDEMKRSYVLEQENAQLENEIKLLKTTVMPIIEVNDQNTQIDESIIGRGREAPQTEQMEVDEFDIGKEVEVRIVKNIIDPHNKYSKKSITE